MMRVDRAEIDGSSEIKELSPLEQALMWVVVMYALSVRTNYILATIVLNVSTSTYLSRYTNSMIVSSMKWEEISIYLGHWLWWR